MADFDLTVIIVSYNTKDLTLAALRTLFAETKETRFKVILVDNDSKDESADAVAKEFPQVDLWRSKDNLGFAKANNLAAAAADTDWLLLLNPDTEVLDGAVDNLMRFGQANPKYGIYGGRTVFPDGRLNPGSCWMRMTPWSIFCMAIGLNALFKSSSLFNSEAMGNWPRDSVREVDIVQGSFLLIPKALWEELGGFAERYYMYGEEADLCLRAIAKGYQPVMTPSAEIMHLSGAASPTRGDKQVLVAQGRASLIIDHWPQRLQRFGLSCLTFAAWLRCAGFVTLSRLKPKRFTERAKAARLVWGKRAIWVKGY